ncbi:MULTISPECIES: MetQ/NlpA family ABC transporter substrate-binding protein [Enterococcus]|uniref:MetQ/NlpA family ABC transporter substrate-binding protein n=1 Tax=Enterococcus TaxID=1350 RepID=UPI000942B0BC|nr:MetQ/NlpA family ABC transporter substrate-binding protein [Enterococcus casseliflavus]NKD28508.1 MetQ/NlpA family ABC transporter substrate-binding protein [Enterococcus casseliflavus]WEL46467.1 MetQ/NlpA family ABC transporter substrate-binding protein [Enterococcus casseliflavus]
MKRNVVNVLTTGVIGLLALFSLAACGNNQADEETTVVKLGVVGEQNEAWEHVQEELKENENIDLQLVKFTDYRQPIVALEDGSIDLHAALTEIFMDNVNEESGYSNTTIAYTTLNPLGIYSDKINDVSELADGATVALPNDVSNESRALLLLQTAGLITLDESKGLLPTTSDVTDNPKALKFELLDSNQTARAMTDVDISLINNGMAVDAGLVPTEDAIFLEPVADSSKPYYNVIAARADEADNDVYQTVVRYYQTDEVKAIIEEVTKKSSIPVWE